MRGGNAITSRAQDRLGRAGFADRLATDVRQASADQGLVVAIAGPWGSGKTSVLNMVKEQLVQAPSRTVLTFNPWMFTGTEQLITAFFGQVAGQLRLKGKPERALADKLIQYGQALAPLVWAPVAGPVLGRIASVASAAAMARSGRRQAPEPVEAQRQAIEDALGKLSEPIVVVIDDLDRLTPAEIRNMVMLVRLTAHFPKVIYLLAFDRAKVELALSDGAEDGRSYLDKIIEVSYDMPAVSPVRLQRVLVEGLGQVTEGITTGPIDRDRWAEIFTRVVCPLLDTPREVSRYLAPLATTLRLIGDEVDLADVLALEALRLRLPDLFALLGPLTSALTDVGMRTSQTQDWQDDVLNFAGAAGLYEEPVRELCRLLFPATKRYLGGSTVYPSQALTAWRRERRVASPEILGIYLGRQVPDGALPAATIDHAVDSLTDQRALQAITDGLADEELDDFLARLESYEDVFPPEAALPACTVLLGLYSRLRAYSLGLFDPGPEIAVARLVFRLLRCVAEPDRLAVVEALCAEVAGLTGRISLLRLVGRQSNPDHERLIPAAESDRLYRALCHEIRHASARHLAAERDPIDLLVAALDDDPVTRAAIDQTLLDSELAAALMLSASVEVRTLPFSDASTGADRILRWNDLRSIAGDDKAIEGLVSRAAARSADDQELAHVVALARRYLDGWRPALPQPAIRQLVIRPPMNTPNMIFSPNLASGWPALLVRAASTYEVDPIWAARGDLAGHEFHDRLTALLLTTPIASQLMVIAEARGLDASVPGWMPDPDFRQFTSGAVQRLVLGPEDQPTATLRYAVFLPDNTGPMKLIVDVLISPAEATDAKWGKLSLEELRDLMAGALEAIAGLVSGQIIRSVFGEPAPRTSIETYVWSAQGHGGTGRPSNTLASTIDLDILGQPPQPSAPDQGMFAVAGDTPTATPQDFRLLATQALNRMAITWGYLDAPAKLLPLTQ